MYRFKGTLNATTTAINTYKYLFDPHFANSGLLWSKGGKF